MTRAGLRLALGVLVTACGGETVRLGGAAAEADGAPGVTDAALDGPEGSMASGDAGGVVAIASGRSSPSWIVVDSTSVYWSENGAAGSSASPNTVMKAATDGTGLTILYSGTGFPQGIAVDDTYVYFLRYQQPGFEVDRIAKSGDPATFAQMYAQSVGGDPGALAVDATSAYFAVGSGILRVPKAVDPTGIPDVLAHFNDSWEIAIDGTLLYVGDRSGPTPLTAVGTSTGSTAWSVGSGPGLGVALDTGYVFWTSGTTVARAPKGGGAASTLAACSAECDAVVADDVGVAWATLGEVSESALDGTQARTIASGFAGIHHAAMDAARVYFTDSTGGGVWSVVR